MGGEQHRVLSQKKLKHGSSPHGRGTDLELIFSSFATRFIPAWAGNSGIIPGTREIVSGSSPHGRGTVGTMMLVRTIHRFIPAWAGNSGTGLLRRLLAAVHPRMGGEQCICGCFHPARHGSSPHGRGTGQKAPDGPPCRRFIPAWAGNSQPRPGHRCLPAVHPRMGGEQAGDAYHPFYNAGSSPHGRGTAAVLCA